MTAAEAIKKAQRPTTPKQDQAEIQAMSEFYGERYSEVYLIRCLNCRRVIGVECAPAKGAEGLITDRGRALFTYQNLCLSVRQRSDSTDFGDKMMGYECICGNDTKLSKPEKGIVAEQTVTVNKISRQVVDKGTPLPASSPFELAQAQFEIDKRTIETSYKPDYEVKGAIERFEGFQLERVK
jgi:hypothetical protein